MKIMLKLLISVFIIGLIFIIALILIMCNENSVNVPEYVADSIEKFMADEYKIELINYELVGDLEENTYKYHFKADDFEFYAYSRPEPGAITSKGNIIYTNISSVIYRKNINKIKELANKYGLIIEERIENQNVSKYYNYDYKLLIKANSYQQEDVSNFAKEVLNIPDIQNLINLRYDTYVDEKGTENFSFSGYSTNMISDYSKIEIYNGTKIIEHSSILKKAIGAKY